MPDIKTRDIAKGTIKTIDKSAVAAERMKSAFIQTKEKAEHSVSVPESSAEGRYSEIQGKTGGAVASKTGAGGSSTKKRRSEYQGGGTTEEGSKRVCPFRRKKDD